MGKENKHILYMEIAKTWARNSWAKRKQVGCIIVKDKMIISDGYNGTPAGFDNCCETQIKTAGDEPKTLPYVLHAEANAITKLAKSTNSSEGADLYVTVSPCFDCAKLIIQSGIARVFFKEIYRSSEGIYLLLTAGIPVYQIEGDKIFEYSFMKTSAGWIGNELTSREVELTTTDVTPAESRSRTETMSLNQ